LATILALVLLSLGRRRGGSLAPAALGRVFAPSR
ncbi:ABC transporter permease, partial [Methylorubrum rhodesianum]